MLSAMQHTSQVGASKLAHAVSMLLSLASVLAPAWVSAVELHGVSLPERIAVAPATDLVLNGAGVRTEASLHRYVAALYLPARHGTLTDILADPGPKRIRLTLLRDMRAASLTQSVLENIAENHTASELESLKAPLDELTALINRLGAAKKGASLFLDYLPGSGTSLSLNGGAFSKPIRGADLYQALLRVWLGEDPVDRKLRRALLGQ